MNTNKKVSDIIRDLREDNDLKQSEIAKIINSTQQQYSRYELGVSDIPSQTIIKLAEHYNVSTDYLLGRLFNSKSFNDIHKIAKDSATLSLVTTMSELTPMEKSELLNYIEYIKYKRTSK